MDIVLLEHVRIDEHGVDNIKTIGVYRTFESARAAVERLKGQPGFRDSPSIMQPDNDDLRSGFYMSKYPLDKDHWTEGFGLDESDA